MGPSARVAAVDGSAASGPPPPPAVDATFRFTLRDVFRASAEASRHTWIAAVAGFILVYGGFFWALRADVMAIVIAAVGIGLSTGWLSAALVVAGLSRRRDLLAREHTIHVDTAGIAWTAPGSSSREAWAMYRRVRDTPHEFLLDAGTGTASFVPKRALGPEQIVVFRSLAQQAGLLTGGSSWVRPLVGCALGAAASAVAYLGTDGLVYR